jgi:PUA domain protein
MMRKQFSKSEIKDFLQNHPYAESFMDKKSMVVREDERLFIDAKLSFRLVEGQWVPSLELLQKHKVLPVIVVDKGAPPFIAKGADLMRPGIVKCDVFVKDAVVVLVDEVHSFPLAVGKALFSSDELMQVSSGKVVKMLFNLQSP